MRLIVECEHEASGDRCDVAWCLADRTIADPDAILAALAEAGVLEVDELFARKGPSQMVRYTSPWKEAK